MKKIYILILVVALAVGGTAGVVISVVGNNSDGESVFFSGPKYDQSTPVTTAKSFILAMLNGDEEGFSTLTRDVIPWSVMTSDLISYSTKNMLGWTIKDYYYHQKSNTIVVYNRSLNPSPKAKNFIGMEFAMSDGKFYIVDLELNCNYGHTSDWTAWDTICDEAIAAGCTRFN